MSESVESAGEQIRPAEMDTAAEMDAALFAPHAPTDTAPPGAPPRRGAGRHASPPASVVGTPTSPQPAKQPVASPEEDAEKTALLPGAVSMREDVERKRRTSVLDELSLSSQSQETYTITVMTGGQSGSGNTLTGTDANVYICLIGENVGYRTGDVWLNSENLISNMQNLFEDGSRDVFMVKTRDIGELSKIRCASNQMPSV